MSKKDRSQQDQQDQESGDEVYQSEEETSSKLWESGEEFGEESEQLRSKLKKLKQQLKQCREEKREYLEGWQRAKADLVNARQKDEEEKRQFYWRAREEVLNEILPVLDSFNMAFSDAESWHKVDKEWRVGVEHIHSQLMKAMENCGVIEIMPQDLEFDPQFHEAVEVIAVEEEEHDGKVVEVVQKGYQVNDRLLRAAKVKVGKLEKQQEE